MLCFKPNPGKQGGGTKGALSCAERVCLGLVPGAVLDECFLLKCCITGLFRDVCSLLLIDFYSPLPSSQLHHAARAHLHAEGAAMGDAPPFTSSLEHHLFHTLFFTPESSKPPLFLQLSFAPHAIFPHIKNQGDLCGLVPVCQNYSAHESTDESQLDRL